MTPNGQTITDNGTIISVPNSAQNAAPGRVIKTGPLHAMQAMRPGVIGEPPQGGAAAAALTAPSPNKKKRAPQGDKKKKTAKVSLYPIQQHRP